MNELPRDQRFEIDKAIAEQLITGQLVIINNLNYIVKAISVKQGSFDRVLVASRIPNFKLTMIEE